MLLQLHAAGRLPKVPVRMRDSVNQLAFRLQKITKWRPIAAFQGELSPPILLERESRLEIQGAIGRGAAVAKTVNRG